MADDNRLLRVMLEEELGLSLESYEHPLKQALGAGLGVLISFTMAGIGFFIGGLIGAGIFLTLIFSLSTLFASKKEGNLLIKSLVWNLATAVLSVGAIHLVSKWIAYVAS